MLGCISVRVPVLSTFAGPDWRHYVRGAVRCFVFPGPLQFAPHATYVGDSPGGKAVPDAHGWVCGIRLFLYGSVERGGKEGSVRPARSGVSHNTK